MSDEDRINSYNLRRATKRLNREFTLISKDPIPGIDLRANEENILEWHFVIHGKEDTPYYGGMYHGKLIFPSNFPFTPPKIIFLTPNGRFKTNERICFSLSDFNTEEWKPAYSITDVLQEVRDFMHDSTETIGSIETSESAKRQLAKNSSTFNGQNVIFCHLFPQLCRRKCLISKNNSNESSKNSVISPFITKNTLPGEITLLPKTLASLSIGESLTPRETFPLSEEITISSREEYSAMHGIENFREIAPLSNEAIQRHRTISPPPPHTTPSVAMPILDVIKYPGAQPSSREVRPLQSVYQSPYTESLLFSKPQNLETNSQRTEYIQLMEEPADYYFGEHRNLPSPPIRYRGVTDSQKTPSSLSTRIIPQQNPFPEREISPLSSETIQRQRNIPPPPHTTPSVAMPILDVIRYPGAQPSSKEVRPSQNVYQSPYAYYPANHSPQISYTNSQRAESRNPPYPPTKW